MAHQPRRVFLKPGHQTPGNYLDRTRAAYWDGRNDVAQHVSSGTYYYSLSTKHFSATRKMMVVR